jgi:uncharacterized protein YggU (UPF0235/DUF167 family)
MIAEVIVAPNSKKFSLLITKDGRLKAHLKSSPENNRANIELIKELSSLTGSSVRILSGHTSKKKKLFVDISEEDWAVFIKGIALKNSVL